MPHDPYQLSDWLGYLTYAEIDFFNSLVCCLPKNAVMINIGAGGGTSGLILRSARPYGILYTLDITYASSPFGCIEAEIEVLKENDLYDEKYYRPITGDSKFIGAGWAGPLPHFVFVDGDHTYEGAAGDITIWWKLLRRYGVMAIHDYKKAPDNKPYPGVDRAVDEILVGRQKLVGRVDSLIAFRKYSLGEH
jgi:hypothetical protein